MRVVCGCGKPLDRLLPWGRHFAPSTALLRPKESRYKHTVRRGDRATLAVDRLLESDPAAGDMGYRWRCRRCGAERVLRADTVDREGARAAEQGRDLVLGVDV